MHVMPGPWLLLALNGAVLAAAVGVAAYVLTRLDDAPMRDDWRAGALELAREVQRTVEPDERPRDLDDASRRLLPLSGRINRHVRAAPAGVEAAVYRELYELGVACQRVAVEHRPVVRVEGPFLEDRLDSLRSDAAALVTAVEDGYSKPRSNA